MPVAAQLLRLLPCPLSETRIAVHLQASVFTVVVV